MTTKLINSFIKRPYIGTYRPTAVLLLLYYYSREMQSQNTKPDSGSEI